jgi:hypothetical protein
MKPMSCQHIQRQLQVLLDRRSTLPHDLQTHLMHCSACQPWQALFNTPTSPTDLYKLPDRFAQSVINRYQLEQTRNRWLRRASYLACAAAIALACFTWFIQHPASSAPMAQPLHPKPTLQPHQLLTTVRNEFNSLTERPWNWPTPSFTLPSTITSWELPELENPLEIGYPTLRNFSQTIQYAIEPFEEPTRQAISKVKAVIEAPEVKKWVNRFI